MAIRLAIFDMAGTTVLDKDNVNICLNEALLESGIEISKKEIDGIMGIVKPVAIRILLKDKFGEGGYTEEFADTIYESFRKRMIHHYQTDPEIREIEGAREVFKKLKFMGVKIGIDTGFSREVAELVIEKLDWREGVDYDVLSTADDVEQGRPAPDLVYRAMKITGVDDIKDVAKVGDTAADLGEGHAAGCELNIGVYSGSYTREELEKYPHTHLLASVREVPDLILKFNAD